MSVSDEFLAFVLDLLDAWGGVTARKMFGGAGLYRDGVMFALVADDGLGAGAVAGVGPEIGPRE